VIDLLDIDDAPFATRELVEPEPPAPIDPRSLPCRYSALKQFAVSPLHYWHAMQDQYEETLSMRLGSGCHAMLFGTPYVVWEGKTRNGKAWDAFKAIYAGTLILSRSEERKARAMCDALRRSELAMSVLFGPGMVHEQRIDWTWNGRAYRSTPDAAPTKRGPLGDLKCLRSARPEDVMWQSKKAHYHAQAALYEKALATKGVEVTGSYLVVVENKAPHPVTVLRFTPAALEQGERSLVLWDEQRRACESANEFPGYAQSVVDLDLPGEGDELVFGDDAEGDGNNGNGAEE